MPFGRKPPPDQGEFTWDALGRSPEAAGPEVAQRKPINYKAELWKECLGKVPVPSPDKTRWGAQGGGDNVEAERLSLVIIEPREHEWMRGALYNAAHVYGGSGASLYIFISSANKTFVEDIIAGWTGVVLVKLPKEPFLIKDYCLMVCTSWFYDHFPTSHCLIFQTDVLMRRRVPTKFFAFDYVGPPWDHLPVHAFDECDRAVIWSGHDGKKVVGNGGFCLRRVEAMKAICDSYSYARLCERVDRLVEEGRFVGQEGSGGESCSMVKVDERVKMINEDVWLCAKVDKDRLPLNHEAAEFGIEHIWHPNPCGLHKAYGSWYSGHRMFNTEMLAALLQVVVDPSADPEDHCFVHQKSCIDRLHPDGTFVDSSPHDYGAFEVVWGPLNRSRCAGAAENYFLHPCDRPLPEGARRVGGKDS